MNLEQFEKWLDSKGITYSKDKIGTCIGLVINVHKEITFPDNLICPRLMLSFMGNAPYTVGSDWDIAGLICSKTKITALPKGLKVNILSCDNTSLVGTEATPDIKFVADIESVWHSANRVS